MSSTDVVAASSCASSGGVVELSSSDLDTLKRTICSDLTNDELVLFGRICARHGLDPFARQVYALKTNDGGGKKLTPVVSIDGLRLIAQRSGKYRGQTPAEWCGEDGQWRDVWLSDDAPSAARVGVLHAEFSAPLVVTLTWRDYTRGKPGFMQQKMPAHMLAKATESLALRKAFPNETSGLVGADEVEPERAAVDPAGVSAEQRERVEALLVSSGMPASAARAKVKLLTPGNYAKSLARAEQLAAESQAGEPVGVVEEVACPACRGKGADADGVVCEACDGAGSFDVDSGVAA